MGNLSDDEIAFALGQQGWRVHRRTIARIRISQGLVRRFSAFQRQVAVDALWDIIKKELDDGAIEGYGRRLLQVHFKRLGCQLSRYSNALIIIYSSLIFIRDTLFSVVRALDPVGVERRTFRLYQQPRGEYIVPGPNYIWSLDGHDKLKHWGIEIYGAIDAYSRYLVWVYVGVSNKATTSVLVQYLFSVASYGQHPQILQTDRGVETPICAEAHYGLSRKTQPHIPFVDTYYFGTSTRNVRIESWWGEL
jgi:hypothetical protein